ISATVISAVAWWILAKPAGFLAASNFKKTGHDTELLMLDPNFEGPWQCFIDRVIAGAGTLVLGLPHHRLIRPVLLPLVFPVQKAHRHFLYFIQQLLTERLTILRPVQHAIVVTIELSLIVQLIANPLHFAARRKQRISPAEPGQLDKVQGVAIT